MSISFLVLSKWLSKILIFISYTYTFVLFYWIATLGLGTSLPLGIGSPYNFGLILKNCKKKIQRSYSYILAICYIALFLHLQGSPVLLSFMVKRVKSIFFSLKRKIQRSYARRAWSIYITHQSEFFAMFSRWPKYEKCRWYRVLSRSCAFVCHIIEESKLSIAILVNYVAGSYTYL